MAEDAGNTVRNSGTITTAGATSLAIDLASDGELFNSGLIRTEGINATAVMLEADSSLTNRGRIRTLEREAHGVVALDGNSVLNSGRIRTDGEDSVAIFAASDFNTVDNSGLVVSAQSDAFWFSGAGNALRLSAPAFIGGAITMSQPVAVDIGTGPSHSVFWTFDGDFAGGAPALSGPVPWFYDAASQTFATYDPTALMASGDQLAALSGAVAELARDRLDAAHARDGGASDGGLASAAAFGAGRLAGDGAGIWIAGLSGTGGRDGTDATLAHELGHLGVAAGADAVFGALTLGAMAGYAETRLKAESPFAAAHDVAGRGGFAGLYGRYRPGRLVLDASLAGGWTGHDQDRFVNDNLAPLGVSTASASYSGWWLSPGLAVALPLEAGRWTFTPALSGRYAVQWLDAYRETGAYSAAANASLAARRVAVGEARGEIALARAFTIADAAGQVALSAGALARADLGDDDAAVTLNGITLALPATADDLAATFLGASASFTLGKARLSLAAETAFGNHGYHYTTGSVELGLRF
jgi:outer membrane autotransporter protein